MDLILNDALDASQTDESMAILAAVENESHGFEILYRRFYPRLVRHLQGRLGDKDLAEDVAQEALLRAFDALASFDRSRPLWPWLKAIAWNLAIDATRRSGREIPSTVPDEAPPSTGEPEEPPTLLEDVISALPRRQQVAVSLRYLNGWRPTEAASFMGISRPAFDQLLFRAKRRLHIEYRRASTRASLIFATFTSGRRGRLWDRMVRVSNQAQPLSQGGLEPVIQMVGALTMAVVMTWPAPSAPRFAPENLLPGGVVGAGVSAPEGDSGAGGGKRSVPKPGSDAGNVSGGGGAAPVSGGGGASESTTPLKPVDDVTNPNRDVNDPEDVQITSFGFGKNAEGDRPIVYAAGATVCRVPPCPQVLFRSNDGGATWERLPATGLTGATIAVPAGHGLSHTKIFATGAKGLEMSEDGGQTFVPVIVPGTPLTAGPIAVSPAFAQGDPTVLLGAQTLMRYNDSLNAISPYPASMKGPFEPALSPTYPADPRFLLGAVRVNDAGGLRPTVYKCRETGCTFVTLPGKGDVPKITLSPDFAWTDRAFAYTTNDLYVSSPGLLRFERLEVPWKEVSLSDVATGSGGHVFASTWSAESSAYEGLYISTDRGHTWIRSNSGLFERGAMSVETFGDTVLVGLRGGGVACSSDNGVTFHRRCS